MQTDATWPVDVAVPSSCVLDCTLCTLFAVHSFNSVPSAISYIWYFLQVYSDFSHFSWCCASFPSLLHTKEYILPYASLCSDLHFPAKRCKLTQFFYSLCLSKVMFELGAAGALIKFAFHFVACSGTVCGACEISTPKGL